MASITRLTSKLTLGGMARCQQARPQSVHLSSLLQYRALSSTAQEAYWKQKAAAKELRTQRYHERLAHKEKVRRRRDGRPKKTRKKLFNEWYLPKLQREEKWNREAKDMGLDWKLQVAVVLERLPQVLPDKPKWEEDWDNLEAYLDQFGRALPEELVGKMEIEELEDLTDEALAKHFPRGYTPAPRETEADHSGDVRTLNRRLKTWVYLTVKETLDTPDGAKEVWRLPVAEVKGEETLLDTAKRAISEKIGNCLDIWYPSNCPMTVHMQAFKEEERKEHDNCYGVKTFFFVVQYDDGRVTPDDLFVDDFAWLEKKELIERIEEYEGKEKGRLYFYLLNDIWRYQFEKE